MRSWIDEGKLTWAQLFAPDGLHMSDGGYDLLAQAVAADIKGAVGPLKVAIARR